MASTQRAFANDALTATAFSDIFAVTAHNFPQLGSARALQCGADDRRVPAFQVCAGTVRGQIRVSPGWAESIGTYTSSDGTTTMQVTVHRIPRATLTFTDEGLYFIYLPVAGSTNDATAFFSCHTVKTEMALATDLPDPACPIIAYIFVEFGSSAGQSVRVLWHCGGCAFSAPKFRKTLCA